MGVEVPLGARIRSAVFESGGNPSLAGRAGRVWRSLNGHEGDKPDTAKADLKPAARNIPEGRVSGAIWNPKGMRGSIGLQSMGATPKTNRSAKDGARSSPHYGGRRRFSFTHRTKVFAGGTIRKIHV